jgi:hypothetical protein
MPDSNDNGSHITAPADASSKEAPAVQTIARRKAILKALGKTAAVAGVASPLSSLAAARLRYESNGKNYQCSVSGNMSVLRSVSAESVAVCSGKSPVSYKSVNGQCTAGTIQASNWPQWPAKWLDGSNKAVCYKLAGQAGTPYLPTATFSQVFGSGSTKKIGAMLNDGDIDAQWVAALLNATKYPTTFPHTPEEVIRQYNDTTKRAAALSFYQLHVNKG